MQFNFPFKKDNIPHALIVREAPFANFDIFIKDYLKLLVLDKDPSKKEYWTKKIDENKYFDLAIVDGKKLKKDEILTIVNNFSHGGIESINIRVFVIRNIEYATNKILNSLLKFIEEPPKGVYIVFTTKNYNAIIPTIRSRCFLIWLPKDNDLVNDFFKDKNLNAYDRQLIMACFNTAEEMNAKFEEFNQYYELIKKLASKDRLTYANDGLNLFKKITYEQISLFLNIVKNLYNNIANEIMKIQDNLYLNTNKTLLYARVFNLLEVAK